MKVAAFMEHSSPDGDGGGGLVFTKDDAGWREGRGLGLDDILDVCNLHNMNKYKHCLKDQISV